MLSEEQKLRRYIRNEVRRSLKEADGDEEKELESELAGLEKELQKGLEKIAKDVEAKAEDEKAVEKALKEYPELKESVNRRLKRFNLTERVGKRDVLNEEAIMLGVSIALAIPAIVTMVGKMAEWASKKLGGKGEVGNKIAHFGEHLHHMLIGGIQKGLAILPGIKKMPKDKQEKLAEIILTVIVATLAVTSGAGAIKALQDSELALASLEGVLTAVKSGEVGAFLSKTVSSMI